MANELFRLIVGSAQPKTYLARVPEATISEVNPYMTVCELAEQYTPLNSSEIKGCPIEIICSSRVLMNDLARITVSSLLLAENDMHGGNIGFCQFNGELRLVKIDGDEALYPLTKRGEEELLPKLIAQNGRLIPIKGAQSIDCFSLNRSDLEQLPAIKNPANEGDKELAQNPSDHFLPFNWAFRTVGELELKKIQNDPDFQQDKDIAIIKFLMIPRQVFSKLADKLISKPELKREFLEWIIYRQHKCYQKMFLSSENCIHLYRNQYIREILEKEIQEFILEMKQDGYEYTENISLNNTILNELDILRDQHYEIDKRLGKEPDLETIGKIRSLDCDKILLSLSEYDCAPSAEKTKAHDEALNSTRAKHALYKSTLRDLYSGKEEEHNLEDVKIMNP